MNIYSKDTRFHKTQFSFIFYHRVNTAFQLPDVVAYQKVDITGQQSANAELFKGSKMYKNNLVSVPQAFYLI
jgi:hypothetical protein